MSAVKARKDAVVAAIERGRRSSGSAATPGLTVIEAHARFEGPHAVRAGDALLEAPQIFINVGGRAAVPPIDRLADVPYLDNVSMMDVDVLPAPPRRHRRQLHRARVRADVSALRQRRHGGRDGPAPHRPRGRRGVRCDSRDPRGRGHRGPARCRSASRSAATATAIAVGVDCAARAARGRSARTCCSRPAGGRTPTTSAASVPASRSTRAATSSSTTRCARAPTASGRWATSTAAARSRTRRTTTTRSSPRTCSTAKRAG